MIQLLEIMNSHLDEMFVGIIAGFVVAISQNHKWSKWKRVVIAFLAGILMLFIYSFGIYIDKIIGT